MYNVKLFYIKRVGNWPLLNLKKNKKKILLTFFGHVLTILACTKCRLVTKHVLSSTYFHSCFLLIFHLNFIYTFMCMIIFLRIIILSFQSHQTRILNAGLGMARNRDGLSCNLKPVEKSKYLKISSEVMFVKLRVFFYII